MVCERSKRQERSATAHLTTVAGVNALFPQFPALTDRAAIFGVGIDCVDLSRFTNILERNPALKTRLFTSKEQTLSPRSLAARFAAKEALIKACGDSVFTDPETGSSLALSWQGIEIAPTQGERPCFIETKQLQDVFRFLKIGAAHLSLTHDGNIACAFVILERLQSCSHDSGRVYDNKEESEKR